MCPAIGIRILHSMCSLVKWRLTKLEVKSAFLQTETAERAVSVVSPKQYTDRDFYGLCKRQLTAQLTLVSNGKLNPINFYPILVDYNK